MPSSNNHVKQKKKQNKKKTADSLLLKKNLETNHLFLIIFYGKKGQRNGLYTLYTLSTYLWNLVKGGNMKKMKTMENIGYIYIFPTPYSKEKKTIKYPRLS